MNKPLRNPDKVGALPPAEDRAVAASPSSPQAVSPVPASIPSADEMIEVLAEVIDPSAFQNWRNLYEYCLRVGDAEAEALLIADRTHGPTKDRARKKAVTVCDIIKEARNA